MAPQIRRAGRGIRLDFPGDQPIYTPGKTSRFLGCWSREPYSRVQTRPRSKWLSPHRSQWARVTLI